MNSKFELEQSSPLDVRSNFMICSCLSYCVSLIMVTITRHFFISSKRNISAVKFDTGYEKYMSFLVEPKSLQVRKEVEKIGLGSFKHKVEDATQCQH